jgi:1-deoxyxylulose-5-phosphate synthase
MKNKINRRQFLTTSLAGAAVLGSGYVNFSFKDSTYKTIKKVKLGSTGLVVPVLAFGTGSRGTGRSTNQTRLGMDSFIRLARHAYDGGLKFFDMADSYGSHPYIREVLKEIPREDTILLTKMWTTQTSWLEDKTPKQMLDRFRSECSTDYFDIVLLHYLLNGNWKEEKKPFIETLSRAKQDGIVKSVGVSCHNWDAMKVASEDPWVDVILARINPFNTHMDGKPEDVLKILETARKNGKGIIGMKVFGNGGNASEDERERSLKFVLGNPNVHCITLGLESNKEVDDAISRVSRIA